MGEPKIGIWTVIGKRNKAKGGGSMAMAVTVNDRWHVTHNARHVTHDTWHMTSDVLFSVGFYLLLSFSVRFSVFLLAFVSFCLFLYVYVHFYPFLSILVYFCQIGDFSDIGGTIRTPPEIQ